MRFLYRDSFYGPISPGIGVVDPGIFGWIKLETTLPLFPKNGVFLLVPHEKVLYET